MKRKQYKTWLRDEAAEIPRRSQDYHNEEKRFCTRIQHQAAQVQGARRFMQGEAEASVNGQGESGAGSDDQHTEVLEHHLCVDMPCSEESNNEAVLLSKERLGSVAEGNGYSQDSLSQDEGDNCNPISDYGTSSNEEVEDFENSVPHSGNAGERAQCCAASILETAPRILRTESACQLHESPETEPLDLFELPAQGEPENYDVDVEQYLAKDDHDGENSCYNEPDILDHNAESGDDYSNSNSSIETQVDEDETNDPPIVSHADLRKEILTQEFTAPISTAVSASPAETVLMLLSMHFQNKSSFKSFVDSVKLVNSLFISPVIPKSAYLLDKVLMSEKSIERYFFCGKCSYYFGFQNHKLKKSVICPEEKCKTVNEIHDLTRASYFALYPLPMQIELLLKDKSIRDRLKSPKDLVKEQEPNTLKDLYGGKSYRDFAASLQDNEECTVISFTVCTDGSPLFKSSNYSIWPFFVSINELPPDIRMKNLFVAGLHFGNKKPKMDLFLIPIVEHLSSLSRGFSIDIGDGEELAIKAFTLSCCVDSGARGDVQGINTHSGYFACNWCEISGEWVGKVVFPFQEFPSKRRTHQDVVMYARECAQDQKLAYVYGVRYLSCLASLPKFNIVNGMVLDYAHNIPFGISRTFLEEWMTNTHRGCYIGAPGDLEDLDKKMMELTPPLEVRRAVRKISDRAHWNAREFENYTRFYSLLVLEEILPLKYLKSWSHLVQGLFLLSRTSVSIEDINNGRRLLLHFEKDSEDLYSKTFSSYNLHICGQHLAENTVRWGPVYGINTFCFENGIKHMKELLHAQRGVAHQINRALCYKQAHQILLQACSTPKTESFVAEIVSKPNKKTNYLPLPECVVIGPSSSFVPKADEEFLLEQSELGIDVSSCEMYNKIILEKCVYTTESFAKGKRFNNSCALTEDGKVVLIKKIIADLRNERVYVFFVEALCQAFLRFPQDVRLPPQDHCVRIVNSFAGRLEFKSVKCLKTICFFSKMNGKMYVGEFPNTHNTF